MPLCQELLGEGNWDWSVAVDLFKSVPRLQKLQHAREESNREVAALKKTIVDLQHRLQQQQQQQQRQQQRENSAGSGFKRLKRY